MSDKNVPIPSYKTSCLAADEGSDYFYLIGSEAPGLLDVNYVPNIFAKTVRQQATITDVNAWNPAAEKACFTYPSQTTANRAVKIIQFGIAQTWYSTFQGNTIQPAEYAYSPSSSNTPNNGSVRVTFPSAKLLAWTGISADYDMFTLYTDYKYGPNGTQWAALSLGFASNSSVLFDYRLSTIPKNNPLLTLGTFAPANGGNSSGYTIVFDMNKQGMIYSTFACLSAIPVGAPLMTLSGQTSVGMNNIVLTKYAIPVTMASTGYILDRAADNVTTIIYSITPSEGPNLSQVDIKGDQTLQFSTSMSAAALGSKIIVYSAPDGANPHFNSFDTVAGKWAGDNLVSNSNNNTTIINGKNNEQTTLLGATIGGVVGLVVIIFAMFFLIRRKRRQSAQKNADSAELVKLNSDENKNAGGFNPGYAQYGPGYVQYDHGYVPYDQGYAQGEQQHQGYQPSPTFPPPPTPVVNQDSDESCKFDARDSATNNPYVSPTSYRDSISLPPASPESILTKSEVPSATHGPQYVPNASVSPSNARSPQGVSSTSGSS